MSRSLRLLLLSILAFGLVIALVVFGSRKLHEYSNRSGCTDRLKRLALALHSYESEHGTFPPAYLTDKDGKPAHSWRVLILPYLNHKDLYDAYRFDEPWNGPHNRLLADQVPDVFTCPGRNDGPSWRTDYVAIIGSQTVWPGSQPVKIADITNGTSNTIGLIEIADSDIHWMEPRDILLRDVVPTKGGPSRFASSHGDVVQVGFVDGSVRPIKSTVDPRRLLGILLRDGGLPYKGQWLPGEEPLPVGDFPAEVDAKELRVTDVSPTTEGRIVPGRNYLYCASAQLAWDELRGKAGAAGPQLEGNPEMAAALNRAPFPRTALAERSYVARMGLVREGIQDAIRKEMAKKFPGIEPSLKPFDNPEGVVAYAFLQKNLPFLVDFEAPDEPLTFHARAGDVPVRCFGIKEFAPKKDSSTIGPGRLKSSITPPMMTSSFAYFLSKMKSCSPRYGRAPRCGKPWRESTCA
jgi:hypothetical protein